MTWLVTGGVGFLGSHLLRRLAVEGIRARSLDLVKAYDEPAGVDVVQGDVRDEGVLRRALDGVDVVVHAAAALPSGGDLDSTNVAGSELLARLASKAGVKRSILISSGVVYGLGQAPLSESAEARPIEAYGRSKLRAEHAWLAAAPAPIVLRPAAFIGPERLGVFGILFRWIQEGRRIYVLGDGSNRYQLLDVDDLVEAVILAATSSAEGVVNVGGIVSGTVRDDLEALIAHARTRSRVVGLPARPASVALALLATARLSPLSKWHRRSADRDFVLDCTRASDLLGWSPTRSGAEALCAAYDWFARDGVAASIGTTHRSAWRERGLAVLRRFS
ncbi:MAG: NAD(P)-dependent oxidoreductase [Actinobacteria bacterium]|nr:NAD(P)-dependent oxidoreductase [Actinomycetota bacterium]